MLGVLLRTGSGLTQFLVAVFVAPSLPECLPSVATRGVGWVAYLPPSALSWPLSCFVLKDGTFGSSSCSCWSPGSPRHHPRPRRAVGAWPLIVQHGSPAPEGVLKLFTLRNLNPAYCTTSIPPPMLLLRLFPPCFLFKASSEVLGMNSSGTFALKFSLNHAGLSSSHRSQFANE